LMVGIVLNPTKLPLLITRTCCPGTETSPRFALAGACSRSQRAAGMGNAQNKFENSLV
jgi:hypothetical protein